MASSMARRSISTAPVPWPGTAMAMGSAMRTSCSRTARTHSTRPAARDTTAMEPADSPRLFACVTRPVGRHGTWDEPEPRHPQPIDRLDPQAVIARGHLIADLRRPTQPGEDVAAEGFDVDPLGSQVQVVALAQLDERDKSVQHQAAIGCRALGISWIAFVPDLAHERLDQVFETDDPRRPPVLIHDHR